MTPDEKKLKPVIGLVGGIGSGKSTVAAEFARLGCVVIAGNAIGHELLGQPAVAEQIRNRWGDAVFGLEGVNRQALAKVVFRRKEELDALNSILHPLIRVKIEERISEALKDPAVPAIVLDAAILIEAGWDELCTHLVFVKARPGDRFRRVAERGWDQRQWRNREKMQIPLDSKMRRCYYVLNNSSSVSHLCERVRQLFHRLVFLADRI